MQPGDLIFIPKNTLHEATSLSKRLSISFPIAEHLDLPPQDRKWIRI
jgi:quercetin dioxygenase-like cupin family protein